MHPFPEATYYTDYSDPEDTYEPMEASIIGAEPTDEFIFEIADWIHHTTRGRHNVEVRRVRTAFGVPSAHFEV